MKLSYFTSVSTSVVQDPILHCSAKVLIKLDSNDFFFKSSFSLFKLFLYQAQEKRWYECKLPTHKMDECTPLTVALLSQRMTVTCGKQVFTVGINCTRVLMQEIMIRQISVSDLNQSLVETSFSSKAKNLNFSTPNCLY